MALIKKIFDKLLSNDAARKRSLPKTMTEKEKDDHFKFIKKISKRTPKI